jgi:hypothetical protein
MREDFRNRAAADEILPELKRPAPMAHGRAIR